MTNSQTKNSKPLTRQEKIEFLLLDDERTRRRAENPLKYAQQHAKQREASNSRHKIRLFLGGNRTGKSEFGAMETAKVALGQHGWIPPGEIWVSCPSYDEQKDTTQLKLLRYIPEKKVLDRTWLRKNILKELIIDAGDGRRSKITFKSYEQGREKYQGAGKVFNWFDEEPPYDIWEEASMRQEAGQPLYTILTMTPVLGMTWVYSRLYLNTGNPDIFIVEAGWDDNPWLTEEQKEQMGRGLTETALKVRREGKFVKQVGLVCSWFSRDIHVVDLDQFGELPFGDTYFGIDFGFSAQSCGLYIRIDRQENLWIFDGFYRRGLTNPDIQKLMRIKEQGLGRVHRIGDSAQASDIQQLVDSGIEIEGVSKTTGDSKESWDEYRANLMEQYGRPQGIYGKPKIFISKNLLDMDDDGNMTNFLVKEIENLRWEEKKTDLGIEQQSVWGKQSKHAIDTLSYILISLKRDILSTQPIITTKKTFQNLYDVL